MMCVKLMAAGNVAQHLAAPLLRKVDIRTAVSMGGSCSASGLGAPNKSKGVPASAKRTAEANAARIV